MLNNANIDQLRVAHWNKEASDQIADVGACIPVANSLVIDTCLRRAAVWLTEGPTPAVARSNQPVPEIFSGRGAYQLLLMVATGLKSSIPGETNVFGQCQKAWREFKSIGDPLLAEELTPIITRLFTDTKEIRTRWLDGAGGTSYGSVVRQMIRADRRERVLFAGAGDLMQSMLPMFRRYPVGVWNHRVGTVSPGFAGKIFPPEAGGIAASWADHIVLTTPADKTNDRIWQKWIMAARPKTVTHLGQRREHRFTADSNCSVFNLDDVFSFREYRAALRTARIKGARNDCYERANQIGGHITGDQYGDASVSRRIGQRVAA